LLLRRRSMVRQTLGQGEGEWENESGLA
jgi:hypothetical protein